MAAARQSLHEPAAGGSGSGNRTNDQASPIGSEEIMISVATLPPPPSVPSFKALNTPSTHPKKRHSSPVGRVSPTAAPSVERLLPPAETPAENIRGEIVRCDIMWSASSANHSELFTPVQNCDIQPIVIVRDADLHMTFDDDDIEERKSSLRVHYRWRRGPARAVCFFHPHRTATKQCTVTLRCFCSDDCFRRGFRQLQRFYSSMGKLHLPRQINQFSYGVPCKNPLSFDRMREPDHAHHRLLRQAGLVVDPEKEEWTVVSYARNFAPTKDDVGHQLKFECVVCSDSSPSPSKHPTPCPPSLATDSSQNQSVPVSTESFGGGTQLVRVVTSAGDASDPAARMQAGSESGPRSSPVNLLRKTTGHGTTPDAAWLEEEAFWAGWDLSNSVRVNHPPDTSNYKSVITCCVVPQAPLVETRPISAVGVLAYMSGSQPSIPPRQRIIPPGSPLAKALGIGLGSARSFQRRRNKIGDPVWNALSARVAQQRHLQAPSVREQREHILTDKLFASWGSSSAKEAEVSDRLAAKPVPRVLPSFNLNMSATHLETGDGFTVMTWNVLADIYATMDAYPYCEPYVLAWSYRRDRILAEVLAYRPDIICLQEVQADHFEDFFAPALLRRGYEGLYKQKTSKVFRGSGKHRGGRYICDGCATFFKAPKFRLLDHFGIEFARVAPPAPRVSEKTDKRLNKDNVALVLCLEQVSQAPARVPSGPTKLKPSASQNRVRGEDIGSATNAGNSNVNSNQDQNGSTVHTLVVANTHILANPEAPDVKIWQANTLTSVLTEYMEKTMMTFTRLDGAGRLPGLVVCGDFNSTPDSAVYQLVTAGTCDARHEELQSSEIYKWLHDIRLGHGLNLKSSYGAAAYIRAEADRAFLASSNNHGAGVGSNGQKTTAVTGNFMTSHALYEPEFTNYTHSYVGCLDYIFFDDRALKVTGTLDLLQELTLMEEAYRLQLSDWALPSPQRSSDHTALLSRFEWTR